MGHRLRRHNGITYASHCLGNSNHLTTVSKLIVITEINDGTPALDDGCMGVDNPGMAITNCRGVKMKAAPDGSS